MDTEDNTGYGSHQAGLEQEYTALQEEMMGNVKKLEESRKARKVLQAEIRFLQRKLRIFQRRSLANGDGAEPVGIHRDSQGVSPIVAETVPPRSDNGEEQSRHASESSSLSLSLSLSSEQEVAPFQNGDSTPGASSSPSKYHQTSRRSTWEDQGEGGTPSLSLSSSPSSEQDVPRSQVGDSVTTVDLLSQNGLSQSPVLQRQTGKKRVFQQEEWQSVQAQ